MAFRESVQTLKLRGCYVSKPGKLRFRSPDKKLAIAVYGKQPHLRLNEEHAVCQAVALGAKKDRICRVLAASDATDEGFGTIVAATYDEPVRSDGAIITTPGDAIVIQSRDCPLIVGYNADTGRVVVAHAGRPAMTPPDCSACTATIASLSARLVRGDPRAQHRNLHAWVLGHICGDCFKHDPEKDQQLIAPFLRKFPQVVNTKTGSIDVARLAVAQLADLIDMNHIYYDPYFCTKEDSGFASKRRQDTGPNVQNTLIVVLQQ